MKSEKHYPKMGCGLTCACQQLAEGMSALGVIVILYRGQKEMVETGITFANGFRFEPAEFRRLTNEILDGSFLTSISVADKACGMLADATEAECVIMFVIGKDSYVQTRVSRPESKEFVAGYALQIANGLEAMN